MVQVELPRRGSSVAGVAAQVAEPVAAPEPPIGDGTDGEAGETNEDKVQPPRDTEDQRARQHPAARRLSLAGPESSITRLGRWHS